MLATLFTMALSVAATAPDLIVDNARIVVGDGQVIESGWIGIHDGRITALAAGEAPAGATARIDAAGGTIIPGLVDAHVHLLLGPGEPQDIDRFIDSELPDVLRGFLMHGVTTILSAGDHWPQITRLRDRLATGELEGPRLFVAGPLLTAPGGHPAVSTCGDSDHCATEATRLVPDPASAARTVSELAAAGARIDAIKLVIDDQFGRVRGEPRVRREPLPRLDLATAKAAIQAAHARDLPALAHVTDPALAIEAVNAGLDGLLHLPFFGTRRERHEFAELAAARNLPVVTTIAIYGCYRYVDGEDRSFFGGIPPCYHGPPRRFQRNLDVADSLFEAGVQLVVGSDWNRLGAAGAPGTQPGAMTLIEMGLLAAAGLSNEAVLQAATANAAGFPGLPHDIGTLAVGNRADLVILKANPLEDLSALEAVEVVILDGRVVVDR